MDARITLSPKVARQRSTYSKILDWMQKNPRALNNTNAKQLANTMRLEGYKTKSIQLYIQRMVNNQMLQKYGGKKRATYRINYLHKDIPPEVLESAPLEERLSVKRQIGGMKQGQYLDDDGCIVTPPSSKDEGTAPEEQKSQEDQDTPVEAESDKSTDSFEANVPVKVTTDGKNLNITININLKLN